MSESPKTLMNVSNLSKVFGPTLVGYSHPEPEPMQMMKETNCAQKVVECLLLLSPDYWDKLLAVHSESTLYPSMMSYGDGASRLHANNERDRGN